MANINDRLPVNVPGNWYVDASCVTCGMCDAAVPTVFRLMENLEHNYVHHQPATEEELRAAMDAKEHCPTESIGNDGTASEDSN